MKVIEEHCQKIITLHEKMSCLCSKSDEPKINIFACTLAGDDLEYLWPHGTITLSIDRKYNIPIVHIRFDDWEKIVFVFGQSILNRDNIFNYLIELHCRPLVLVCCLLMTVVSIPFFSF